MLHVVNGIILIAWLPVHASESLHCLNWYKVTAVFVLYLLLLGAWTCFVVGGTTYVRPPIYAAVVPGSR